MRHQFRKLALATATALGLSGLAPTALAGHIPGVSFGAVEFTVTPGAVGEPGAPFDAKFITFNYRAEVDQAAGAPPLAFDETGGGFFTAFSLDLGGAPIGGLVSGLGVNYNMYTLFSGAGTVVPSGLGIDGTFSAFDVSIFVDKDMNTTLTVPTVGLGGGDESIAVAAGGADDVLVLTGTLLFRSECVTAGNPAGACGGFHVFPGLAAGDFDVTVKAFPVGGFFAGEAFETGHTWGDINGVNSSITGVLPPPFPFTDGIIIGSGNVSFAIPEPNGLALLALALLGAGAFARRREKT